MNYQLTLAIKQRKCSMCSTAIPKATKHFTMNDWPKGADFPTKKNICLNCAPKLTDPEFVSFLKILIKELEHLESLQQTINHEPSTGLNYTCPSCHAKVKYNSIFESFQCVNPDCDMLYNMEDTTSLLPFEE